MITPKQLEVLKTIHILKNEKGYSPTVREITSKLGLSSHSTVHLHIDKLKQKGYVNKLKSSARSLVITDKGNGVLKEDN